MKPNHLRSTLAVLWKLNFSIVATSLLWSVSCIPLIEASSLAIRIVAMVVANLALVLSSRLIVRNVYGRSASSWRDISRDRTMWSLLLLTGFCLVLSLENIQKYQGASGFMRIYVVGIFLSMVVGWLFVGIVVVPIRMWSQIESIQSNSPINVLAYLKQYKFSILLGLATLLLGWPIFFIYLFLALGFAQAFQITNLPLPEESSEKYLREKQNGLH
jgi:hypothetical protein